MVQNEKFPKRSLNAQNWEAGGTRQQGGGVFFSCQVVKEEKKNKFIRVTRIVKTIRCTYDLLYF